MIHRHLLLPSEIVLEAESKGIFKLSSSEFLRKCVVKTSYKDEKNAFDGNLESNGLAQVELLGFPEYVDLLEERLISFVKKSLNESDIELNFNESTREFFNVESNREKLALKTRCEVISDDTTKLFSGSQKSLYNAIALIEDLYNNFVRGKLEEKVKIPLIATSAIDLKLILGFLEGKSIKPNLSLMGREITISNSDGMNTNDFYESVGLVKMLLVSFYYNYLGK